MHYSRRLVALRFRWFHWLLTRGPLFTCIAFSELALFSWKVPSHSLEAVFVIENTSPGPASYMTTVKSPVGPSAPPTGPTANGVADGKVIAPRRQVRPQSP